ncbi:class II aldolase/adducin family protein [Caballeronia sp. LZ008]|uniref:class II aldolase/adducin family protein n=1 Tax=Caballeronia sp. INML5 TaxID=2921750 RepID=UPI002028134C|nr:MULTISPECIES: class II aldolase/adducin family protein [unclassified Caballeronia]MDR5798160.1 class II aldolase/adducin family protein [Caballeronia sp. LZ008]
MKTRQNSKRDEREQRVREDLAAAYRLIAHFGLDDSIDTHISARVPGTRDQFLINPYGLLFQEITASSLVKIDTEGRILERTDHVVNPAGFVIHSAIHQARHDAECVAHTHTVAGVAVASLACGLQPCNQWALQFHRRIAYHAFEGIAVDLEERARLVADLGTYRAMILRNHGLLTCGSSVAEALILMLNLDRACRVQLAVQASGQAPHPLSDDVCDLTASQYEQWEGISQADGDDPYRREWDAYMRRLNPTTTSYLD